MGLAHPSARASDAGEPPSRTIAAAADRGRKEGGLAGGNLGFPPRLAGGGNRTRIISLEGWSSTIELHPRRPSVASAGPASRLLETADDEREVAVGGVLMPEHDHVVIAAKNISDVRAD